MAKGNAPARPRGDSFISFGLIAFGMIAIVFVLLWLLTRWHWYLAWLSATGLTTFVLYGVDKAQAKRNGWRCPEVLLHTLALIGGFIGGWLGMFVFRHKTQHPEFKLVLGLATLIWLGVAYFVFFR